MDNYNLVTPAQTDIEKPINDSPQLSQNEQTQSTKTKSHLILFSSLVLLFLVLLAGTAYAIYSWQHNKVTSLDNKVSNLQQQISSLDKQLSDANAQSSQSNNSSAQSTGTSSCNSSDLSLSLGQPVGTAGTSYINLILTNTSSKSCTLYGYPVAVLTDSQGQQLGQAASQNSSYSPITIALQPNQTAHAAAGFPDASNFSGGSCAAKSTYIKVTPPNNTSPLQATTAKQYCPGFSVTTLQTGN